MFTIWTLADELRSIRSQQRFPRRGLSPAGQVLCAVHSSRSAPWTETENSFKRIKNGKQAELAQEKINIHTGHLKLVAKLCLQKKRESGALFLRVEWELTVDGIITLPPVS